MNQRVYEPRKTSQLSASERVTWETWLVVRKKLEQGFKLAVVDHSIIGPSELVDGLHPSYAGYFHMGEIWLEAIKTISAQGLITAPIAVQ